MKAKLFEEPRYSRDAYCVDGKGRRYSLWRLVPGVASEFIHPLPDLLRRRQKREVVLYVRVSSESQRSEGNLDDAKALALRQLKDLGCTVLASFAEVTQSSVFNFDRIEFERAIEYARQHGAVLVAPSRDRFLRGRTFDGTDRSELPTVGEYIALRQMTAGVLLATIHPPDAPARSSQIKRGQAAKGTRVGRPRKATSGPGAFKRRRIAYLPKAEQMRARGWSYRRIAHALNQRREGWPEVSFKTVWNWIRGFRVGCVRISN